MIRACEGISVARQGPVCRVEIDRPEAMNALTLEMYECLEGLARDCAADADLRAVVIRGVGGRAFAAGSDISIFQSFRSGRDGIDYERKIDSAIAAVCAIPVPVVAVVDGWAIGGGLCLATACDIRIATPAARFGVPIARTVGNCLSMRNYAHLLSTFGQGPTAQMLMLGEILNAEDVDRLGYLVRLVPKDKLDETVEAVLQRLLANAPLTLSVTKQALSRLRNDPAADGSDLIERTYGSEDFSRGVSAFFGKTKPVWAGN